MLFLVALPVGIIVGAAIRYGSSVPKIVVIDVKMSDVKPIEKITSAPLPAAQTQKTQPQTSVYVTKPDDIIVPDWVWVGDELQTVTPLRDRATGGYARLNYAGALAAAKSNYASLISRAGVEKRSDIARKSGVEIAPVTLPDVSMMKAAGVDPTDRKAVGAFLNSQMRSAEWAKIHDDRVAADLKAKGWNGKTVTSNIGKPWTSGAPAGKARLFGWRKADGSYIQQENDDHDLNWSDYGTTTILRKGSS